MAKEKGIRRFSETDLEERRARGESRTDLARVRAKTAEELERDIASDADFSGVPEDWYKRAEAVMPTPKKLLSLRLDSDVVDWFKQQGPGYQTRINAVLRALFSRRRKGEPEAEITAPRRNPNRDNPSSFRADNWAETGGRSGADR
jgi:uncharacterized protein (DUF4415 family)